jgi:hypothetical protein
MFNFSIPSDPLPEELEAKVDRLRMIYYLYAIDHDARSLAHAREFSAEEIAKFRRAAGVNLAPIAPRPAAPMAPRHLDLSLPLRTNQRPPPLALTRDPGLRPPERANPVGYEWVPVGNKKSFANAARDAPLPPLGRPNRPTSTHHTTPQTTTTPHNPPVLSVDADTRRHLMQATESEVKALWKQRFGKPIPATYKSQSAVVEAYLLGYPKSNNQPRNRNPVQLRNAEWTVTRGGAYANAARVNLPNPALIVRDIQRRISEASLGEPPINLLGGRWSSNMMAQSANFVLIFAGHPDPTDVMRHADILAAPFGSGSFLIPKAGFSRIRLFGVPVYDEHDSTDHLIDELTRNPDLKGLNFIEKPRWFFRERRRDQEQVVFTIFDPQNEITPKILRTAPFMFGKRCRARKFDSRPMLRQCDRCHKLGHSLERCPRPDSLIRCRICGNGHATEDHDLRCLTKMSHKTRGCDCPPKCFNCKDAGKSATGHNAYDPQCPLRLQYRTPFVAPFGDELDDTDMMAPPAPAVSSARIDDEEPSAHVPASF